MVRTRGVRGANSVKENSREAIRAATKELLSRMIDDNQLDPADIASIFLTATEDIDADFPAYAARDMGLLKVPLLCAREISVPNSMPRLIRILIHVNTEKTQDEIKHQYLGETKKLRPDLCKGEPNDDRGHEI